MLSIAELALTVHAGEIVALAGHDQPHGDRRRSPGSSAPAARSPSTAGDRGLAPDRIAALGLGYVPAGRRVFGALTVDENLTSAPTASAATARSSGATRARDARFPWPPARRTQIAGIAVRRRAADAGDRPRADERAARAAARGAVGGLGPTVIDALAAALEATRDAGTAILLAEEGLQLVRRLADRVLLFEDGRVVLDAP